LRILRPLRRSPALAVNPGDGAAEATQQNGRGNMVTKQPETLTDLLKTLERSTDLRSLARDCGLSVRELRRRLSIWRRTMSDTDAPPEKAVAKKTPRSKTPRTKGEGANDLEAVLALVPAADLPANPLPAKGSDILEIFTDGASRGNPGPASIGILFRQKDGPDLAAHCEAIGMTTNNMAEYQAVVSALEHCRRWGVERVHLFMDSELIVRQLSGAYRVKSPDLRPLYQQVVFLTRQLKGFKVTHVKRALNSAADALANHALDRKG